MNPATMRITLSRMAAICLLALTCLVPVSAGARVDANIVYGMYSGLALLMDVYYPEKPNRYGIVHITGTGWHDALAYNAAPPKESEQVRIYGSPLVTAGYTVFALSLRAAPRFHHPAAVEDAQRAVRFIRNKARTFGIDPDRIGGVGGSSGGHLILMLGVLDGNGQPDDPDPVNRESAKLQCIAARAAPVDLIRMNGESGSASIASMMGLLLSTRDAKASTQYKAYWAASPINHVSDGDAPVLMIHGDADVTVPIRESETLQAALQKAGIEAKLIRIPGGAHGPTFPGAKNPPDYLGAMVGWFDTHLRNH